MTDAVPDLDALGDGLELDVEALRALRDSDVAHQLLDIREDWEREICALPGSIDIAMGTLPDSLDRLSREMPVVVVCHFGARSLQVAAWLRHQGFARAFSVRGGIDAWARLVDTSLATY